MDRLKTSLTVQTVVLVFSVLFTLPLAMLDPILSKWELQIMPLGQIVFNKILGGDVIVAIKDEILTLVLNGKVSSRMRCLLLKF